MGKSTISTGPFSIATLNYQRVNPHDYRYYSNCPQLRHGQNSSFRGSCGSGEVSEETCQVSNDLCFIYEYIYIYNNTMIIYIYFHPIWDDNPPWTSKTCSAWVFFSALIKMIIFGFLELVYGALGGSHIRNQVQAQPCTVGVGWCTGAFRRRGGPLVGRFCGDITWTGKHQLLNSSQSAKRIQSDVANFPIKWVLKFSLNTSSLLWFQDISTA